MVGVDRDMAALAIAMANKIECKSDYRWIVEGTKKGIKYNICFMGRTAMLGGKEVWTCQCLDYRRYKHDCKHIRAVRAFRALKGGA
jgi:hypothetical protein